MQGDGVGCGKAAFIGADSGPKYYDEAINVLSKKNQNKIN